MNRPTAIARGVGALLIALGLVLGVPTALWSAEFVPSWGLIDTIRSSLSSDDARIEAVLRLVISVVAWTCWAQIAAALVTEALSAVRGGQASRVGIVPGAQALAARLVGAITLVSTIVPTATPALAAPPPVELQLVGDTERIQPTTWEEEGTVTSEPHVDGPVYVTRARDSLWSIAEAETGDGLRWREIRDLNVGRTMDDGTAITARTETIQPGWRLFLPADSTRSVATPPDPVPTAASVKVAHGDHFWAIARRELSESWGRAPTNGEIVPYWRTLVDVNQRRLVRPGDPDVIFPGQVLDTPALPVDPDMGRPEPPAQAAEPPSPEPPPVVPDDADPAIEADRSEPSGATAPVQPRREVDPQPNVHAPLDLEEAGEAAVPAQTPGNEPWGVPLGIGGVGIGAGALAIALRRRRAYLSARRPPGTSIPAPPEGVLHYEQKTRAIADSDAARWIEVTNRFVSHQLAADPDHPYPAIIAARAGAFGVELLLDEPCPAVQGFTVSEDQPAAWHLDPDLELDELERLTASDQPYSPGLVIVGSTDSGDLLLDLEQLAVLSVEGHPEAIGGWQRSIVASIATTPWSELCDVIAIGIDSDLAALDRVEVPDEPAEATARVAKTMTKIHERLDRTSYQQRVDPGEIFHPTIVLVGPGHAAIVAELAEVAALARSPLAVIAAEPLGCPDRILFDGEMATIEPAGLTFTPVTTSCDEIAVVNSALDAAADLTTIPPPPPEKRAAGDVLDAETVKATIEETMRPRPIEVQLLVDNPRVGGLGIDPPAKQAAVIAFLAYHSRCSSQRVREEFWPASTSRKTSDNALSIIRKLLGEDEDGNSRLSLATNTGEYELSTDVGCDWLRAKRLIEMAKNASSSDEMDLLRAALSLVEGQPGRAAPAKAFSWLRDDCSVYQEIERVLADAAARLARLGSERGDVGLVEWSTTKGLLVVPGHAALVEVQRSTCGRRSGTVAECEWPNESPPVLWEDCDPARPGRRSFAE